MTNIRERASARFPGQEQVEHFGMKGTPPRWLFGKQVALMTGIPPKGKSLTRNLGFQGFQPVNHWEGAFVYSRQDVQRIKEARNIGGRAEETGWVVPQIADFLGKSISFVEEYRKGWLDPDPALDEKRHSNYRLYTRESVERLYKALDECPQGEELLKICPNRPPPPQSRRRKKIPAPISTEGAPEWVCGVEEFDQLVQKYKLDQDIDGALTMEWLCARTGLTEGQVVHLVFYCGLSENIEPGSKESVAKFRMDEVREAVKRCIYTPEGNIREDVAVNCPDISDDTGHPRSTLDSWMRKSGYIVHTKSETGYPSIATTVGVAREIWLRPRPRPEPEKEEAPEAPPEPEEPTAEPIQDDPEEHVSPATSGPWMDAEEVCQYLKLENKWAVYAAVTAGLPAHRVGVDFRFLRREIDAFLLESEPLVCPACNRRVPQLFECVDCHVEKCIFCNPHTARCTKCHTGVAD